MAHNDIRIHEVTFCGRVMKWAEALFKSQPESPFKRVEIEESKGIKRKRSDLRIYDHGKKLLLAGEVKLPGTPDGRNPYDGRLVEDAFLKASNAGAQFFFTWNVNKLVLFDSSLWQKPLYERRVKEYDLGLNLQKPADVDRAEVEEDIRAFLAAFFIDFAQIVLGEREDWGMAPDELFVRAFECHISWAVKLTSEFLAQKAANDPGFDQQLQRWMARDQSWQVLRSDPAVWRMLLDRAARTFCYVFSNRLIFYESLRVKFEALKPLSVPRRGREPVQLYQHFQELFKGAVEVTGDYETLFYPFETDWGGLNVFGHEDAADAWRSVLENLRPFNFKAIRSDILGAIFQRLIAPEERHKFGQFYTHEDIVDVVNAFCLRKGSDIVLDPACGSGSFLVRAYHRKAWLDPSASHQERISQLYGSDIALFAAHLATLNLAARDINDEENYPRIARRNFLEIKDGEPFCYLPSGLQGERTVAPVILPAVNAIVGNPPYVRQELIPKRGTKDLRAMQAKEDLQELAARLWPGLKLGGRSDLHCYFWPASTAFLKDGGWFGFIVSSSWLDVEYGFALQEWILRHFRLHAVLETQAEPWFEDARVKTCAVILQRCNDQVLRPKQLTKFVQLKVPLAEILGVREDENSRQKSAERLRELISRNKESKSNDQLRIIAVPQRQLWEEGLRAGRLFAAQKNGGESNDEEEDALSEIAGGEYGGGKWGKYLRAPDLYFTLVDRFRDRFVQLGEIARIRFGVKSGCDAFFMPHDVTSEFLAKYPSGSWNDAPIYSACKRVEVESGVVALVQAGDGTVHPVERDYLEPEVHSLMKVDRPVVTAEEFDRRILLVSKPVSQLKGTYVSRYLRFGEKSTFDSKKSKPVPVPERSTCSARQPWYDLTGLKRGILFWPMAQQYRHVVPANPERLVCNHNLFDVHPHNLDADSTAVLPAVLNSTLVALTKTFFGRYAGTEGNLKTEVVDVNLLEIPDPRHATKAVQKKLEDAFRRLCQRDTMPMVEEAFMECRTPERAAKLALTPIEYPAELKVKDRNDLDLAVFEMLGVTDPVERERLCDELYYETAKHFRQVRIVEIQKQKQRAGRDGSTFSVNDLALDLWDALTEDERSPLEKWLDQQSPGGWTVIVPDARPSLPPSDDMLDAQTVFFQPRERNAKATALSCPSRGHAELIYEVARCRLTGEFNIPVTSDAASALLRQLRERLEFVHLRADQLARSRTSDESQAADIAGLLRQWMLYGKP